MGVHLGSFARFVALLLRTLALAKEIAVLPGCKLVVVGGSAETWGLHDFFDLYASVARDTMV
eukprot:12909656-Prorocentrum_lima.AAC.1